MQDAIRDKSKNKGKLYHSIPSWVPDGSPFHIRIRSQGSIPLTEASLGDALLQAARHYHECRKWFLHLMVLMPDHLHAVLAFPQMPGMSRTVGSWKHFLSARHGVAWQDNYFDHRLRNEGEFLEKMSYIRMNPVRGGLCGRPEDWPWCVSGER